MTISLTGLPLYYGLILLCLVVNVFLIFFWNKFRGKKIIANAQRFGILAFAQLLVVITTFVGINHSMVFYGTWQDLFGNYQGGKDPITQVQLQGVSPLQGYLKTVRSQPDFTSKGGDFAFSLKGVKSKITAPVFVYLPPSYGQDPLKKWPVLMLLPGFPGVPTTWFHAMDLQGILRQEVAAGRARDFVMVLPTLSVAPPRDTECTNIPGGPQVNTWLGVDVPRAIMRGLSVSHNREDWAITGYSTGGFCAAKIALSNSEQFSVAIPIAAYFEPFESSVTGNLFGGSKVIQNQNSPLHLAKSLKLPIHMLLVGTGDDPGVVGDIAKMEAINNPNLAIDQLIDRGGGHTTKVWKGQLPRILHWLSTQIP